MRYFFLVTVLKKSARALRSHIKVVLDGEEVKIIISGIKLKRGHQIFYFYFIEKKNKSARASRSRIKVGLEGEEVKLIISGDQFKKRASNALFLSGHCIEKNPLALRARI